VRKSGISRWLEEANRLDLAVYGAIVETPTPGLDGALGRLSRAADYSRVSIGAAAVLALAGGTKGRRAAARGLASVAVTATIVNAAIKPVMRRRRPDRTVTSVPLARQVPMPASRSFPSGHSAAAFAFAAGTGGALSWTAPPLAALATLVAYSRVHTGVHYPADVIAGSLCGIALAAATGRAIDHVTCCPGLLGGDGRRSPPRGGLLRRALRPRGSDPRSARPRRRR
jgi:membrane-associated phospholipid phosphatase